jgi:hypothetical protein
MRPMIVENINSVFTFGKHKNKSIKEVALIDPSYIEWLCKTVTAFVISTTLIDELSDYCLSTFFADPELYLNEKGSFTLLSWQHLKYKDNEIIIGGMGLDDILKLFAQNKVIIGDIVLDDGLKQISQNKIQSSARHIRIQFSRQVFDGDRCKKNLSERIIEVEDAADDYDYEDNSIDTEDLRRSYNDAYEIDSNEFDGWHEPID